MILTRTPYRVSLFGGGSDYPEWFSENKGSVLGLAINRYAYLGVKRMPPGQSMRYRLAYSKIEDVMEVDEIRHPAIRGCLKHLVIDTPLEVHCAGDLASGGGLGASSAFVVGLLHSLRLQFGLNGDHPAQLADEAIHVEREVIREAVGWQDQLLTAFGGLRHIKFSGADWNMNSVELSEHRRSELERSMVLVYSGSMRYAHVMAAKQLTRLRQNTSQLRELAAMATEAKNLLEDEKCNLDLVGRMLHSGWMLKRELHPEISTGPIDQLYTHGRSLGALGGKLCGAGGGGFLLFWVPEGRRYAFEHHIGAPCLWPKVSDHGTQVLINEP